MYILITFLFMQTLTMSGKDLQTKADVISQENKRVVLPKMNILWYPTKKKRRSPLMFFLLTSQPGATPQDSWSLHCSCWVPWWGAKQTVYCLSIASVTLQLRHRPAPQCSAAVQLSVQPNLTWVGGDGKVHLRIAGGQADVAFIFPHGGWPLLRSEEGWFSPPQHWLSSTELHHI